VTGILASIRNAKAKKRIQAHDADRIDVLFHALAPGYPKGETDGKAVPTDDHLPHGR